MVVPYVHGYRNGQPIYSSRDIGEMTSAEYDQFLQMLTSGRQPAFTPSAAPAAGSSYRGVGGSDVMTTAYFRGAPESDVYNLAYGNLYTQAYNTRQQNLQDPRFSYMPGESSVTGLTDFQKQKAYNMGINPNATDPTLLSMWLKSIGTQPGSMYKGAADYQAWAAPYLQQIEQQRQQEAQERNAMQAFEREMMREAQVGERLGSFYQQATRGVGRAYQDYLYGPSTPQERTLQEAQTLLETSGLQWRERDLAELQRIAADPTYRPQRMDLYGQYVANRTGTAAKIEELQREISGAYSRVQDFLIGRQNAQQQMEEDRRRGQEEGRRYEFQESARANYQAQYQNYLNQLQGLATRGFYQTTTPQYAGVTNIPQIPMWALTASQQPAQPAATPNYAAMAQQIPSGPATAMQGGQTALPVPTRPVPVRPTNSPPNYFQRPGPFKPRPGFPSRGLLQSAGFMGA